MNQYESLTCSDYYQSLMQPFPGDSPCGEALDYDPAFIMLQSRLQPKLGAEYGDFVEAAEPVNWTETERDCQALLQKSKDVRLVVILMRCRLRKRGLSALAEGAEALLALLQSWPDELHPQLLDEGEFEPMLRANAFAELEDIGGLLTDLRSQPLPKASGLQITVKEFEKAHQLPREEGALSDEAVAAIIREWHTSAREEIRPLTQAHYFVQQIKQILAETLGHEAPELPLLSGILGMFSREFGSEMPARDLPLEKAPQSVPEPVPTQPPGQVAVSADEAAWQPPVPVPRPARHEPQKGVNTRAQALQRLQEIRSWFAVAEPSSPLVPVLKYAEESIGKSFAELQKMYPPEVIAMLNQEKE